MSKTKTTPARSYKVIYEDSDTRIHVGDKGEFEFDNFDAAKEAALAYLSDLIAMCQGAKMEIEETSKESLENS